MLTTSCGCYRNTAAAQRAQVSAAALALGTATARAASKFSGSHMAAMQAGLMKEPQNQGLHSRGARSALQMHCRRARSQSRPFSVACQPGRSSEGTRHRYRSQLLNKRATGPRLNVRHLRPASARAASLLRTHCHRCRAGRGSGNTTARLGRQSLRRHRRAAAASHLPMPCRRLRAMVSTETARQAHI